MNNNFYIGKYSIWSSSDTVSTPNIDFIAPSQRRRLTEVEKIGLFLANSLEPYDETFRIVFASQYGEWHQTIKLIKQMYEDNEMSPAGFSHSVHNAMPGLFTILNKQKLNYTTVAANEQTIENALIEAISSDDNVLFIYAEETTPDFYKTEFSKPFMGHGIAFKMSHKEIQGYRKVHFDKTCLETIKEIDFQELSDFIKGKETLIGKMYTFKEK